MDLLPKALQPLKSAARAFFRDDLRLRRDDGRLRIVLEDPRAVPVPAVLDDTALRQEQELVAAMRRELAEVLDDTSETRAENRHLAFFERVLATSGMRALKQAQLELLEQALAQLESLVTNWSPQALACLRSKMAVTLRERRRPGGAAGVSG